MLYWCLFLLIVVWVLFLCVVVEFDELVECVIDVFEVVLVEL